jgi:G3E family GTPase
MKRLPVTIVSGFSGAGKTTLLNHLINNRGDLKIAVLVNDARAVNIAAQITPRPEAALSAEEILIAAPRGCICCSLQEEMVVKLLELAAEQKYDYLFIEATGIAEPRALAERFTQVERSGGSLAQYVRLDTMVTVVDCRTFLDEYVKADYLIERGYALDLKDERTIVDVLIHQVEFANVILLNKTDKIPDDYSATIAAILKKLNPEAEVIRTTFSQVPLEKVINTNKFDFATAEAVSDWAHEAQAVPTPETEKYGISSFVYRSRKPFHPGRFMAFLQSPHPELLRAKGLFWLCTRMAQAGQLGLAGASCSLESAGYWLAALPEEEARADAAQWEAVQAIWDADWGDRRQELVFIGYRMDHKAMIQGLDAALLTDEEMDQSPAAWAVLEDAFGEWDSPEDEMPEDEA